MNSRVTMSDIARKAGVHVTTVSMALRNHRNLPTSTIERIKKLAKEMGYRPDPALNALVAYRSKKSKTETHAALAYITNWEQKRGWEKAPAHLRFYKGAKKMAEELGYRLEHFWLGEPDITQKRLNDMLIARGINGLLFASHIPNRDAGLEFDWSRFSAVKIDFHPSEPPLHSVTNDQSSIVKLAFNKVREFGYRRIGIVFPKDWDAFVKQAWTAGFLVAQQSAPPEDRVPILSYDIDSDGGVNAPAELFKTWMDLHKPDALISYKPFVSKRLAQLKIKPPKDIGYADIFLEDKKGETSGVINNCERVGEIAIAQLVARIQQNNVGLPKIQTTTLVEGSWVNGKTLKQVRKQLARR